MYIPGFFLFIQLKTGKEELLSFLPPTVLTCFVDCQQSLVIISLF